MQTKSGMVVFTHNDAYKGEIEITKGGVTITVSMESLRKVVAESVRADLMASVLAMKPESLLRRIA